MSKEKYYRSPIDRLVVESGIAATKIAQKMGIKYHRMVALRRVKDVSEKDIKLCKDAILAIDAGCLERIKPSNLDCKSGYDGAKAQPHYEYLLGQAMVFVDILKHYALRESNTQIIAMIERLEKDVKDIF